MGGVTKGTQRESLVVDAVLADDSPSGVLVGVPSSIDFAVKGVFMIDLRGDLTALGVIDPTALGVNDLTALGVTEVRGDPAVSEEDLQGKSAISGVR